MYIIYVISNKQNKKIIQTVNQEKISQDWLHTWVELNSAKNSEEEEIHNIMINILSHLLIH